MFNRFSKWLEDHRGLLAFIGLLLAIYLKWSDSINKSLSKAFNISFVWLNQLLKTPMTLSLFCILLIVCFLIRHLWKVIRLREIVIIRARYFTPKNSIDITDRVKGIIKISRDFSFPINNETAGIDPDPGTLKNFEIEYKVGKKTIQKNYTEHDWVRLI